MTEEAVEKGYFYIAANQRDTVLYAGSTSNLKKRMYHHRNKLVEGFSKRYNIRKLIYFEKFENRQEAFQRERQIKKAPRRKKLELINSTNPEWKDLHEAL